MKHIVLITFLALALSACTAAPSLAPVAPTPDVGLMATQIAFNIFATQTASAPPATVTLAPTNTPAPTATPASTNTPTLVPPTLAPTPVPPTLTPTSTLVPTSTPDAKATEAAIARNVMATLTAAAPTATPSPTDEWGARCAGTPPGMVCLWVHNYRGGYDTLDVNIATQSVHEKTKLAPGGDWVVFLPPGKYPITANSNRGQAGTILELDLPDRYYRWYIY